MIDDVEHIKEMQIFNEDLKHLCYKCSIGRHSQHSEFIGKGKQRGLWEDALITDYEAGLVCRCPRCFNGTLYGVKLR